MTNELHTKAVTAATRFFERKDIEVLDSGYQAPNGVVIDLIGKDEDTLVFADVTVVEGQELMDGKYSRSEFEFAVAMWLGENSPEGDVGVRFDRVDMCVVAEDRALLRHHINCFETMKGE